MITTTTGPAPTRPCPACESTSFLRLNKVDVQISPPAGQRYASAACPRFTMLTCMGCGKTDWFTSPKDAASYFGTLAERVDIPGSPPYR